MNIGRLYAKVVNKPVQPNVLSWLTSKCAVSTWF